MQVLAKKMTVLYKLSKEQLSSQHHYDFGLRALKSVLVMAGSLKRSSPDMSEALVLMRALRDMNLPKFVYDDVPLFLGLINDLFPGKKPLCLLGVQSCMQTALHCSAGIICMCGMQLVYIGHWQTAVVITVAITLADLVSCRGATRRAIHALSP